MNGVWCVIPVKRLALAKQRLAVRLGPDERRAFVLAMLRDVLTAASASGVSGLLLATSDPEAAQLGREYGAESSPDPAADADLSASVGSAVALLARRRDVRRAVVVAADLPFAEPSEIAQLAGIEEGHGVVLASDRAGTGTNAVALDPSRPIAFAFGPGSLARHEASARALGLPVRGVALDSLAFDIDVPADLDALATDPRHTRASALARRIAAHAGRPAA